MAFSPHELFAALARIGRDGPRPKRYVVALSGGVDSVALLHALSQSENATPVVALHVDHALREESAKWGEFARAAAESAGVDFAVRRAEVRVRGQGLEAAAREARYRIFEDYLVPGDWLLTAHHQDDQAETFLLHALRGSGPRGLAGITEMRSCGAGHVVRPLLSVSRAELATYAEGAGLRWLDDPANAELRFDRNFLRHEVLPLLRSRWPAAAERLSQSARLSRGASELLDELGAADLERLGSSRCMSVAVLSTLSAQRQINAIRFALRAAGLPAAPGSALERIVHELLPADEDAQPLVGWPGAEVRRYRDGLYLLASQQDAAAAAPPLRLDGLSALGSGHGALRLIASARGLPASMVRGGLEIRYRRGGERLRPQPGGPSKKLKALLQEAGIVPWMRPRIPLLFHEETLVAVADLWLDQDALTDNGYIVQWIDRPALH